MVGSEIRAAGAQREMLELAENYSLPVAVPFFDYGAFPLQHPNYIGMLDTLSDDEFDVVCCVGYRQNTRASIEDDKFPGAHTIISFGHDPSMMGNTFAIDFDVWGNIKHSLQALNGLWKPDHANLAHIQRRKTVLATQAAQRAEKQRNDAAAKSSDKPVHPIYLGDAMARNLAKNTLLVSENFRASDHLMPFGYGDDEWELVRTSGGSLGYGLGGAIGAQLATPDRPVVLSIGDGGVMYSSSGFWTMARYSLPILTVVWNNMNYQTVRTNFAAWGGNMKAHNKYPETFLGDPAIDFVMLAKAQGIEGEHVYEPEELDAALQRGAAAQVAGEPYLLDVHITNVGAGANSIWYKQIGSQI